MRNISNNLRNAIWNKNTLAYPDVCKVCLVEVVPGLPDIETKIPQITNVNVTTNHANFSNTATFTMNSVNPTNPQDMSYFGAHRNDATHNKPANSWQGRIVPGKRVKIYMGKGTEICSVFYGEIDTVQEIIEAGKSGIEVTMRDFGKRFIDNQVWCNDTSATPNLQWELFYPIANEYVTPVYLTVSDTDPNLEDIVIDICRRVGFAMDEIHVDPTGIKLSETLDGYLEFSDTTWDACINKIKDMTIFDFWIDEEGHANFKYPPSKSINVSDEEVFMFGTDPQPLEHSTAIDTTVTIHGYSDPTLVYRNTVDYIFNQETNTITRLPDGVIDEDLWVKVDYTYVDFVFKNGVNIIKLPKTYSLDKVYGRIKVTGDGGVFYIADISSDFKLWDGAEVSPYKMLTVKNENLVDEAACQRVAEKLVNDMKEKYIEVNFTCMPLPQLQMKDIIQVIVLGAIREAYIVNGQTFNFDANAQTLTHQIQCTHWAYVSLNSN